MTSTQIAVLIVVVIAVVAVAAVLILQNRTKKLRARFGPEYDRALAETGNKFKAENQDTKSPFASRKNRPPPRTCAGAWFTTAHYSTN